ncbi:MAG TPA: 4'-phosphopantetheinyl transferase superfamily protein, partial [Nitrospira sp.]|nr:4'-phosphopantetheinyl transferase superfamily protein [Nitrospira sp.]
HGKPALSGQSCAVQDIQFSLSHSGAYAVVAVAAGRAVGVDVEVRRPDVDALKLAERFFAAGEAQQIIQAQGDAQQRLFYRSWTAKEAYLKGRGVGLSLGLDRFEILFDDGSPLAHVRMTDSGALDTNWQVQSLSLADDVSGALAVEGQAWQVRMCDSSTDLFR